MTLERVKDFLQSYPKPVKLMEVCGTHTSSIAKGGLRSLLSPSIRLVSGPGCPVCVTPASYIDKLAALALEPDNCVLCFGDLFRVPGSLNRSLAQVKSSGGRIQMIYTPLDALDWAQKYPERRFIVAAVGFETTTPAYAVLLEELLRQGIKNVRLCTALKTMPAALDMLCGGEAIDGFLCPGHVSSIIGSAAYDPLCARYQKPFVIAGFTPTEILCALYRLIRQLDCGMAAVENLYPSAVTRLGNSKAQTWVSRFFIPSNGLWRGIGEIPHSALTIKSEYADLEEPYITSGGIETVDGCRCGDVMLGRIMPEECALFGLDCHPEHPVGSCMVSGEGACGIHMLVG